MVMKKEAKQIQETNFLCASDKERLESSQSLKWHLCVCCEAQQTGRTQDQVVDSTFKKQKEHKLNRVKRHKEFLLKREKRMLVLSNLEAKGKAPAMVAKDVKAHNDLVPKLKESSVEDDKVTLSEDSGELTPEDLINKVLMADEGADKVTVVPEVDDKYIAFASKDKAQDSYIPASSYQEEWVSSEDSTCSCNSSLQILAACFTCCVVRV